MVLMLPCDDGGPRVELALLLIDLLPPEAREALPWRPQHTWEEEAGGRQKRRSRVHPHLAMQPPSSYSPYSLLTLLLLLIYCSSVSTLFPPTLPVTQLLLMSNCPLESLRLDLISPPWEVAAEEQKPEQGKSNTP